MLSIGQRIHNRRVQLNMSVNDLAEKLGKNRATVYRYESNDITQFDYDVISNIAKALDTTPDYFYGVDDEDDVDMAGKIVSSLPHLNVIGLKKVFDYIEDLIATNKYRF